MCIYIYIYDIAPRGLNEEVYYTQFIWFLAILGLFITAFAICWNVVHAARLRLSLAHNSCAMLPWLVIN